MDKVLHASVYGVIALLLKFSGVIKRSMTLWFLVIGIGLLDELHQATVVGRQSSVADLMADAVGVTLGILIIILLTKLIIVRPDAKL
jgi:VanZ family protein